MGKHSNLNRQILRQSGLGVRTRVRRIPGTSVRRLATPPPEAQQRLLCLEFAEKTSVSLAALAFGVHRSTIYQ